MASRKAWLELIESGKQLLHHDGLLLQPGKPATAGKRMVDHGSGSHSIMATTQ